MELQEIDWAQLRAAYGPAVNVPQLFAQLESADAAERGAAISGLWSCLCHQGTVYEASAVAVPFLFEAARTPAVTSAERTLLLGLIVHIGVGEDSCWEGYASWDEVQRCAEASASMLRPMLEWARAGGAEARTWVLALAVYNVSISAHVSADLAHLLEESSAEVAEVLRCLLAGEDPDPSDLRLLVEGDTDLRDHFDHALRDLPIRRQARQVVLELADTDRL